MGLFGDIAKGLAGAALERIGNTVQNGITKSQLEAADAVGILFETSNLPFSDIEIRNALVKNIMIQIGNLLDIKISDETVEKNWNVFIDDSYADGSAWDAFVIKNKEVSVKYGLCGMAQCAISVTGDNCGQIASAITEILEENDFDNIQFFFDDIPFHEIEWLEQAESQLYDKHNSSKEKGKLTITNGEPKTASILINKLDEIVQRTPDEIFTNPTALHIAEVDSQNITFSDGITSIEWNYDNGLIYIDYSKNNKSLVFSFIPAARMSTFEITFDDTSFKASWYPANNVMITDAVKDLRKKKLEIPEGFCEHIFDFLEVLSQIGNLLSDNGNYTENESFFNDDEDNEDSDNDLDGDDSIDIAEEIKEALEILELSEDNASVDAIKKSYRRLAKEFHPDRMQELTPKMKAIAENEFTKIQKAYGLLLQYFDEE